MLALASDLSRACGETLERWIDTRAVSEERLFSLLYFPLPRTDPPKFTTEYDQLSDRDILALEEAVLSRSPVISYAVLVDRAGYLPTHNRLSSMPLTGNLASDLVNNRTKCISNDRTGLGAARSTAPFLVQRYQRDTGDDMIDLSVPVFVRGKHWGAVRIGFRPLAASREPDPRPEGAPGRAPVGRGRPAAAARARAR
jgi:methyl-accepting chemotaxis protein